MEVSDSAFSSLDVSLQGLEGLDPGGKIRHALSLYWQISLKTKQPEKPATLLLTLSPTGQEGREEWNYLVSLDAICGNPPDMTKSHSKARLPGSERHTYLMNISLFT